MRNVMKTTCLLSVLCAVLSAFAAKDYCVIDLSGGPDAAKYPVSYLDKAPEGGFTKEFQTTKLVLRAVAPGTFTMGSPDTEFGRGNDETLHRVTLSAGFYIGVFEVTRRQWQLVTGEDPCTFRSSQDDGRRPVETVSYEQIRGKEKGSEWPASAEVDADSFLGRLRAKTGLAAFDLPTEAQWEYACRAGTETAFSNGGSLTSSRGITQRKDFGKGTIFEDCKATTWVGCHEPNPWGLYDMHGHVCEWCLDRYAGPLDAASAIDPKGSEEGLSRVVRGGSGFAGEEGRRSAARLGGILPSDACCDIGFRLTLNDGSASVASAASASVDGRLLAHLTFDDYGNGGRNALKATVGEDGVVRENRDTAVDGLGKVSCVTDAAVLAGLAEGDGAVLVPTGSHIALPVPAALQGDRGHPFTIQAKVRFQTFSGYNCLLNMPADNRADAFVFLGRGDDPEIVLKQNGRVTGKRGFAKDRWCEFTFQFAKGRTRIFADGVEVLSRDVQLLGSRADCSRSGGYILLSADDNGEDLPVCWADVKVYDGIFEPR